MKISKLRKFLWNCIIINFVFLVFLSALFFSMDTAYQIQSRWFLGSKEEFVTYVYYVMTFYKLLFFFFNIVPYVALRMLESKISLD